MPELATESTGQLPGLDANAREALAVWECACESWTSYISALAKASDPVGAMEANIKLMADSFNLYGRAANAIPQRGGIRAPLLNDG